MTERLREIFGDRVTAPPPANTPWAEIDGHRPKLVVHPRSEQELSDLLRICTENTWPLLPVGSGHTLEWGSARPDIKVVACLDRLGAITHEDPADLVLSAQAGVPLKIAQARAKVHGLRLAMEPPGFARATIGGLLALGQSGASRAGDGRIRDQVLGMRAILSDGTIFATGGRVVKNVAGYDLSRLLIGSRGTLAVITEATFKLRPCPPADITILSPGHHTLDGALESCRQIRRDRIEPHALVIWGGHARCRIGVRLSGEKEDVAARRKLLPGGMAKGVVAEDNRSQLQAAEAQVEIAARGWDDVLLRLAVPPSTLGPTLTGLPPGATFFVDAAGGRALINAPFATFAPLRELARNAGGFCLIAAGPPAQRTPENTLDRKNSRAGELGQSLQRAFDPAGILATGRGE